VSRGGGADAREGCERGSTGVRLGLILLTAFAVRAIVLVQLADHPLLQPLGQMDAAVYAELGRQVAGGDVLLREATGGLPLFVAPLYAWVLGLVFAVSGGSLLAAKAVQVALGTTAVGLAHAAARPWMGPRAALVAAGLLALCGPVVFHETLLLQAAIDPFLVSLALVLVTRALGRGRGRDWAWAGVGIGLFALNRPNALLWGVVLAAALLLTSRSRRGAGQAAALALGLTLAVSPATLRNLAVSGEPVLLTSHGGLNLYIGNHAGADGTYNRVPGITPDIRGQVRDARLLAEEAAGRPLTTREVDGHFAALARDWVRTHPVDAARLFLRKLAYVLSATEITLNASYAYYSRDEPTLLTWLVVGAWILVPLGLAGLADRVLGGPAAAGFKATEERNGFALWALVVPAYAVSVAVFFVSSRYRLPLLVPLSVGAGFALVRLARALRHGPRRLVLAYAVMLVGLLALAFWPHRLDDGRAYARGDKVVWLIGAGRDDEARALLERTLPEHPEAPILLFRTGRALQARGRAAEAVPLLERALEGDPGRGEVHYALGQCLVDLGRHAEAAPHLRAAFAAGVRRDLAGFDLARALASAGRPGEAAVVLEELASLELDAESRRTLARLAVELGAAELARRFLNQVLVHAPGDAATHLNLAVLHAQEGRFGDARSAARRALELRPGYPQAQALLERLE
jgi:Flp pilus assembly protein TadD